MKLELKHLAPYLPYGLKMISTCDLHEDYEDIADDYSELLNKGNVFELYLITTESIDFYDGDCDDFAVKSERIRLSNAGCFKPILRPLSDLTKEIEVNGEKFVPRVKMGLIHDVSGNNILNYRTGDRINILSLPYYQIEYLFEWHFDVFGLIEQGLAIDINTLEP